MRVLSIRRFRALRFQSPIDQLNDAREREILLESRYKSNELWEVPADFLLQLRELFQRLARRVLQRS